MSKDKPRTADKEERYAALRLENQLCFPLYACAKEVVRRYHPLLTELDLTYTQYIAMMVLWDRKQLSAKELGEILFLDSGTLTPLLKKMEDKGFLKRERSREDERVLMISLTKEGEALQEKALHVPDAMAACVPLSDKEAETLYGLLYKVLEGLA